MFTSLLLATASLAAPASSTVDSAGTDMSNPLFGAQGELLGSSDNIEAAVGGTFANPFIPIDVRPVQRDVFEITLHNTGTGWDEQFLLAVPANRTAQAPLLVAFHAYSSSPYSVLNQTDYLEKARARGWWAIAPLGAHQVNYGIDYALENINIAIEWVMNRANIDPDRIYGIGFSMGGGTAAALAAHNLDPNSPRFAALVNHTGTTSVRDVYNNNPNNSNPDSLFNNPQLFGGSPDEVPFRYANASAIDYDRFTDTIDQGNDLARNLSHMPVLQWAVGSDPLNHLVTQTERLDEQLTERGGDNTLLIGNGSEHAWDTLSERQVLNFLEGQVRQDPSFGTRTRTLVPEDGTYWYFDIDQRTENQFARFDWRILPGLNRIFLERVSNIEHMSFDPIEAGMQGDADLQVILQATESDSIIIEVAGFEAPPVSVTRDSVTTLSWEWDPVRRCITLLETDPSAYRSWIIER